MTASSMTTYTVTPTTAQRRDATRPVRSIRRLCAILLTMMSIGAAFAATSSAEKSPLAAARSAIQTSHPEALRRVLPQAPEALTDKGFDPPFLMAVQALQFADTADRRHRAREVIRIMVRAGAPLNQPMGAGGTIPFARIGTIPNEQPFLLELLNHTPVHQRCALVAVLLERSNIPQQWQNALASLEAVPAQERSSRACGALFTAAIRGTYGKLTTERTDGLLDAGYTPTPAAADGVLKALPANPAARDTLKRVLSKVDLDQPYGLPDQWGRTKTTTSLFTTLLQATLDGKPHTLHENLVASAGWLTALKSHASAPLACQASLISHANAGWRNLFDFPDDEADPVPTGLVAATDWMVNHCTADEFSGFTAWPDVVTHGHGDLVQRAYERGLLAATPNVQATREAALCAGDDQLYLQMMKDYAIAPPSLRRFMACLQPPETASHTEGDIHILHWLLKHGADPDSSVDGAAAIGIARYYDRDDVSESLLTAGAKKVRLTGHTREYWLRRRLDAIMGYLPPPLSFEERDAMAGWSMGGGLERVDLDGDGRPEYINHDGQCGTVNCQVGVLAYRDRRWHVVLDDAGYGLDVLDSRHHGWLDLAVSARASAVEHDRTAFRYNGTRYEAAICEYTYYGGEGSEPDISRGPCEDME